MRLEEIKVVSEPFFQLPIKNILFAATTYSVRYAGPSSSFVERVLDGKKVWLAWKTALFQNKRRRKRRRDKHIYIYDEADYHQVWLIGCWQPILMTAPTLIAKLLRQANVPQDGVANQRRACLRFIRLVPTFACSLACLFSEVFTGKLKYAR